MKHGRRHTSLKEKIYRERARQDAPGYKRAYEPIDVRPPDKPSAPPPADADVALAAKVSRKTKHALRHLGIDVNGTEDST